MRRFGRRSLRLTSVTLVLTAALLAFLPTGSGAEEPFITGWWQRAIPLTAQSAGTPVIAQVTSSPSQLPPPPTIPPVPITIPPLVTIPDPPQDLPTPDPAPSGGLMVANDPAGPRAIAALRFDLPKAGGGILQLVVTDGSTPASGIRACPVLSDWQAGGNQGWSRRPAHDCARVAAPGTVSADGTTVSFVLPGDFRNPLSVFFDVVLVPVEGDGTPFQTIFEKPGADALEVTSEYQEPEPYTFDDFDFDIDSSPYYDPELGYTPELPYFEPTTRDTVVIAPTANASSGGGGGNLRRVAGVLENPTARRIAALALIFIGGYAYWQSGQSMQRAPRLLGSLGGSSSGVPVLAGPGPAAPRGIGRFARVRRVPAQRL